MSQPRDVEIEERKIIRKLKQGRQYLERGKFAKAIECFNYVLESWVGGYYDEAQRLKDIALNQL